MNNGMLGLAVMTFVMFGCASRPPEDVCRKGIEDLEYLQEHKSVGGILNDRFTIAIAETKALEAAGDFQGCKRMVSRTRARVGDPHI